MAAVGSYIRALQERPSSTNEIDDQLVIGRVLKAVGAKPVTIDALRSSTGMTDEQVRMAVEYLLRAKMLSGLNSELAVTDLGRQAQFIVAD